MTNNRQAKTKKVANFHATQAGFRVNITDVVTGKVIASQHFNACFGPKNGWGSNAIDKCFDAAKKWAAGFGCA